MQLSDINVHTSLRFSSVSVGLSKILGLLCRNGKAMYPGYIPSFP